MSLAHKLYNIGESITDESTIKSLIRREPNSSTDYQTVAINFTLDNQTIKFDDVLNNICEHAFYSEKLGGSGTSIFYLYPNLLVHDEILVKIEKNKIKGKFSQLIATLENIISYHYSSEKHEKLLQIILKDISDVKILNKLKTYSKGNYLYLITINNKSIFELMPEIWENWFFNPAIAYKDAKIKTFYDYITSKETSIGYNPDIGCYTVYNYNDKLKHRIVDNLPLSKESAKYIKFGWLYVKKHLLFYFDGMQFIIIPSYAKENAIEFKEIILKLKTANENGNKNRNTLKVIANEEEKLTKELNKLGKLKKKDEDKITHTKEKLEKVTSQKITLKDKIPSGLFTNFCYEVKDLEFVQGLTLDFIFVELNKNEVKIFGSLEEVIPSKILKLVDKLAEHNIDDRLTPISKDYTQTYLHDFFHRDELYFYEMNKRKNDPKDTSYRSKILAERFYLAKLLLDGSKISKKELYKRFEFNVEYDYKYKKRFNDKMVKVWIDNTRAYKDEKNILSFFNDINILKD